MKVSVVIPCFKSPKSLTDFVDQILASLLEIQDIQDFEVILVVDGDKESTWKIVKGLAGIHEKVRGILLSKNFGQHQALAAGLSQSRFDFVLTLDDDGQQPASQISKLVHKMTEDTDVIYGVSSKEEHGIFRNTTSRLSKFLFQEIFAIENARSFSTFRFIRASIFRNANLQYELGTSLDVFLSMRTNRAQQVIVDMQKRIEGKSNYTLRRLLKYAAGIIISTSRVPLKLTTWLGLIGFFSSLIFGTYILFCWLAFGVVVEGYTSLLLFMAFSGSINLLCLGVLGEYLGSVHNKVSRNPAYMIAQFT